VDTVSFFVNVVLPVVLRWARLRLGDDERVCLAQTLAWFRWSQADPQDQLTMPPSVWAVVAVRHVLARRTWRGRSLLFTAVLLLSRATNPIVPRSWAKFRSLVAGGQGWTGFQQRAGGRGKSGGSIYYRKGTFRDVSRGFGGTPGSAESLIF
jgi:hypothetical protein